MWKMFEPRIDLHALFQPKSLSICLLIGYVPFISKVINNPTFLFVSDIMCDVGFWNMVYIYNDFPLSVGIHSSFRSTVKDGRRANITSLFKVVCTVSVTSVWRLIMFRMDMLCMGGSKVVLVSVSFLFGTRKAGHQIVSRLISDIR
jgi:hypothetical protein